ncbi:MAG TPA: ATP-binding protein, partial [Phototrophicaceae bacterium]|jgi:signal transduction histidine kinase|nr:ATP-binding protein [Phototrophicaceae bacterium]
MEKLQSGDSAGPTSITPRNHLQRLARWLITPHSALNDEEQYLARLLAAISLTLIGLMFVVMLSSIFQPLNTVTSTVVIGGTMITFFTYLLSRTRAYKFGIVLLLASIYASNITLMITNKSPDSAMFMIVPIFIMSLVSSATLTTGLASGTLLILSIILNSDEVFYRQSVLLFLFVLMISVLIVISVIMRSAVQRQLEERTRQLEASGARFRAAIEGSMDSFYLLESVRDNRQVITDFRFVDTNQHGAAMIFKEREQIVGQNLCELLPINRTGGFFDKYVQVVETGKVLEEEFPINSPGIRVNWLHHQVVPVGDGIAITSRDISKRKAAELDLRDSEARNRAILEVLPDLLMVISRDGDYLDYHTTSPMKFFSRPESFIDKNVRDVLPPAISSSLMEQIELAFETGNTQVIEYQLELVSGKSDLETRIVAYGTDKVLMIVRDVTDRKRGEQNALAFRIERERMRILSDFIRSASHEFRTPLAVINSGVNLMVRTEDPQIRKERAHRIEEQVHSMAHLVDNMVLMARLDSNLALNCEPVNLVTLIQKLVREHQVDAAKKQQHLQVITEVPTLIITGDHEILSIALKNLIDNAVLYTPTEGEITIQCQKTGSKIHVLIQDNGVGIPEEVQSLIFERFYRADTAHSTRGFGLGLPIAKKIIELHQGELRLESKPDQGTLITLIFDTAEK